MKKSVSHTSLYIKQIVTNVFFLQRKEKLFQCKLITTGGSINYLIFFLGLNCNKQQETTQQKCKSFETNKFKLIGSKINFYLVGVTTLLLSAVNCPWVKTSIAPVSTQDFKLQLLTLLADIKGCVDVQERKLLHTGVSI